MRGVPFLLLALLSLPAVAAEFGPVGADGWPINVDGQSTNPFAGMEVAALGGSLGGFPSDGLSTDPLNQPAGTTLYPYWPALKAEVERLAAENPDRVRLHVAGTSTLGLDLFMLEIADFAAIEAGTSLPLEQREVIWVDGGTHSNEYSGVYFALAWAQFLAEGSADNETAKWILENRHTWVMPMVNPDGSNAFGRLNAKGVNVNRNYPVVWDGQGHDATLNNRGPSPASEIETQVNIEWFNLTSPDYYASVHCCGNLWLYPYGEEGVDPIDAHMLSRVCDEVFADVRDSCGPIWSTIYPASGSSIDTAYEYTGAVAFGYEMSGRGAVLLWGQPITFESVQEQEMESWAALLHASLNVHRYGAHLVAEMLEPTADGGLQITLRNDGWGNFTAQAATANGMEVQVPRIPAGEARTILVPASVPAGGDLVVDYAKRLEPDSNRATLTVPLEGRSAVIAEKPLPGVPLVAVLALLGLALLAAMRRGKA